MWSASGDERANPSGVFTISLGRLQYIRWGTASPTERRRRTQELLHFAHAVPLCSICLTINSTGKYVWEKIFYIK
jgi:hypothetical protein